MAVAKNNRHVLDFFSRGNNYDDDIIDVILARRGDAWLVKFFTG